MRVAEVSQALSSMLLGFEEGRGGTVLFCSRRKVTSHDFTVTVILRNNEGKCLWVNARLIGPPEHTLLSVQTASSRSLNPLKSPSGSFSWQASPRRLNYEHLNQQFKTHLESILAGHGILAKSALPFWRRWLHSW